MKPLHICYISQEYPPETGWGGIGSYTYEMAHGLVEAGHQVTVISRAGDQERVLCDSGVEVHRVLPAPDWSHRRGLWRLNRYWPGFAWAAMKRLRHVHGQSPVDVVEAGEGRADSLFVPWLSRRPKVVVRLHTARIFVDRLNSVVPDRERKTEYWLEKQAIANADALTAPSRAMVDLTATWLPLHQCHVSVVPNPVNTKTFYPDGAHKSQEVLFVGRLERRKGVSLLAQSLPKVLGKCRDSSFRFVGSDGVDFNGCSWRSHILGQLSPEQRSRVSFEQLPREQLVSRYRQASLCVMPSVWENFPYALLEAMACGTPSVATRVGGLVELVENGVSGVLVSPGDPDRLVGAICELLGDSARREEMGRNARSRAENLFSTERVVVRMLAVYQAVLDGDRR